MFNKSCFQHESGYEENIFSLQMFNLYKMEQLQQKSLQETESYTKAVT